jgi:hypothetical protein
VNAKKWYVWESAAGILGYADRPAQRAALLGYRLSVEFQ